LCGSEAFLEVVDMGASRSHFIDGFKKSIGGHDITKIFNSYFADEVDILKDGAWLKLSKISEYLGLQWIF
jgi:hypothetical protein